MSTTTTTCQRAVDHRLDLIYSQLTIEGDYVPVTRCLRCDRVFVNGEPERRPVR